MARLPASGAVPSSVSVVTFVLSDGLSQKACSHHKQLQILYISGNEACLHHTSTVPQDIRVGILLSRDFRTRMSQERLEIAKIWTKRKWEQHSERLRLTLRILKSKELAEVPYMGSWKRSIEPGFHMLASLASCLDLSLESPRLFG